MFKWAAGEELIPAIVPQSLTMVTGLRQSRTEARETSPVMPGPTNELLIGEHLLACEAMTTMRKSELGRVL